jgi:predicted ATPase/DNA-binding SARP family transcriptional activator/thioredoxin-like negative regulator of GroEL
VVEVRVLGPVELVDGDTVVRLPRAERTVLAALAARVGERVPVDVLADAVWPQQRPPSARKSLQGRIVRLRRALGTAAIVERDGAYLLDPGHVDVDAERVARLVTEAREAIRHSNPDAAVGLLAEASAAFRGEPYDDVSDTALPAGEAQRLQELRAAVVEEGFEAELARGFGEQCIGDLEAYVQANPYRERAWGQLMLALYQAGRPAEALGAYSRARVLLAAELGIEPGPALRDMERAILTHDTRLLNTRPVSAGLGAANVPAAVSPIIGRQLELAALETVSLPERLVTLTGVGGISKTRLAIELAAGMIGCHEYGPFFVDLVPIGDAELIPAAVAAALGVQVDPHDDVTERVRSALADHSIVVVIDNCEHLLPGVAELIAGLLASAAGVRLVATSREPLGVAGERVWPLDPLGVPPETSSPDQIRDSESAALFLARLPTNVAARPLSVEDVAAVGAICRSLEGMPLALELAAARSRTLSLPELAERLEHSISELALPGHGVSPRHRSIRAALDWGYRLLSAAAQQALRAMSVFAGGCELPAFDAVCLDDDGSALEVIDELVRTSFVVVDAASTPTRYRLLEPVRQFAAELLAAAGEEDARRQRHLRFFGELARTLDERQIATGKAPLEPLLRELGNLRAALDWAQDADETEAGLCLAADMEWVWIGEAHHAEGLARIVALLGRGTGSPSARSKAACSAGSVASYMGRTDQAVALCEQALHEARRAADEEQERYARLGLAQCLINRGDIDAARRHLAPALPAGSEQTSRVDAMCILTQAAWLDNSGADFDAATTRLEQVLTGPYSTANWIGTRARETFGYIMLELGDHERARSWFAAALELAETNGEALSLIESHLGLVQVECAAGHLDEADTHFRIAAQLRRDTNSYWDLRYLQARATLALHSNSPGDSVALAAAALALADDIKIALERCECLRLLGDAQLAIGDLDQARPTFEQLIALAGAFPAPCRLAEGHEGAAAAAYALGSRRDAHEHLAAATGIRQRTGTRRLPRPAVENHLVTLDAEHRPDPPPSRSFPP